MNYCIGIPSYGRPDILKKTTLLLLEEQGIARNRINIFLRDEDERERYGDLDGYKVVITEAKGIKNTRNFLRNYFATCEEDYDFVLFIDDDINEIRRGKESLKEGELYDLIVLMYETAKKEKMGLVGICGFHNHYFLKDNITKNLKLLPGGFCGILEPKRYSVIECTIGHGEDYEFSIKHFIRDGGVIRLNNYGLKTKYYNEEGGICLDMGGLKQRNEKAKENLEKLVSLYPKMCCLIRKKEKYDLRLNHRFRPQ